MPGSVVFEEEQSFDPIPRLRPRPPTMASLLVNARIAGSPGDAAILLAIATIALIGVSFYLLAASAPPVSPMNGGSSSEDAEVLPR